MFAAQAIMVSGEFIVGYAENTYEKHHQQTKKKIHYLKLLSQPEAFFFLCRNHSFIFFFSLENKQVHHKYFL